MTLQMPKLTPIPIPTKQQSLCVRIWRWIFWVRRWTIIEDWHFDMLDHEGKRREVIVPAGFRFDGASIPRPLWGLLSPIGLLLVPGLLHDFAYRYDYLWVVDPTTGEIHRFGEGAGRKHWDAMFRRVGTDVNGMALIDMLAWAALGLGGSFAWRGNRRKNEAELYPDGVTPDR
jgi:hypothetical protein